MDPQGKVALVTGAASGIGLACTKALLASGAKVALCDRNAAAGNDAIIDIAEKFGQNKAIFIQMDVKDQQSFKDAFEETKAHFNGIDIVVNCAGIANDIEWEEEIDINLKGTIRGSLLAMEYLGKDFGGNGGVIVNVASIAGIDFYPVFPVYAATKHGVIAASKCLGMPFHYDRTGVKVLVLCPSKTDTPLVKSSMNNVLRPEWIPFLKDFADSIPVVPPETVAKSFMKILKEAENGDVWVSEGEETYCLTIPDRASMRRKE